LLIISFSNLTLCVNPNSFEIMIHIQDYLEISSLDIFTTSPIDLNLEILMLSVIFYLNIRDSFIAIISIN